MGKKSIRKILLSLAFFQVAYILAVIVILAGGVYVLIIRGLLYSPNDVGEMVQELIQKIDDNDLVTQDIPDVIEYARISDNGSYIEGTIENLDIVEQVMREGQIAIVQFMNGITYRYVQGGDDNPVVDNNWILGYRTSNAQFKNKFLRMLFPSADMAIILMAMIAVIAGFWMILNKYRNSLSKELTKITDIRRTILNENTDISGLSSNIKEVDEIIDVLKEMEKLVKSGMKKQLEQSQLLEEGIQALTHDIQTPATVVSGNIELLEETQIDERQRKYLRSAKGGIARISGYVEELKGLSKLEEMRCQKKPFSDAFVRNLITVANDIAALKNISVQVNTEECADELLVDQGGIMKAYQNIVTNAVAASAADMKVVLDFKKVENDYIVSVINRGMGFTPEGLKKATNRFYSENKARNDEHYGLGLSIVERIMKEHGGCVVIENIESDARVSGAKVSLVFSLYR